MKIKDTYALQSGTAESFEIILCISLYCQTFLKRERKTSVRNKFNNLLYTRIYNILEWRMV